MISETFVGEKQQDKNYSYIKLHNFLLSACLHDLDLSYYTLLWQLAVVNINLGHANNIVISLKIKLDMQEWILYIFFVQSSEIMEPFAFTF